MGSPGRAATGVYVPYMLSETNAEHAIASGAGWADEVRDWRQETLEPVFANGAVTVVITGYIAAITRAAS